MSGTKSQTRQHEVEEEDEVQIVESSNMKGKFKWSQTKDEDLCKSWLTISNDGATGNHQSYNSYWQRIVDYYNEWRKGGDPIDIPKASNHWFKMSVEVSKFNGCYIQIKESHPSGHNEESLKNMANQLWSTRHKNGQQKTFPYLHSWEILRHQPKWEEFANRNKNSGASKRQKNSMTATPSTNIDEGTNVEEISEKRPIGQKASKAASKGRGSKKKGSEDFVNSFGEYKELQTKKFSLWEERIRISDFEILTKDTSNMDDRARKDHEQVCNIIRAKYGIE
ncbi:glutathione S-transferase T3-like [Silene latifolia]|uniref:glutathione S-transferase T3-like n=1 Tax=Silene latifolia TaxID=37657 RepID=UPI003D777978